ncbi:cobalamin biosynthesis protein CobC [Aureimonas ureilytica]|uniref:threonine-phosphate decarboxylase n=1 Tax=Aureimonas ureilytica TaxID=401562 RepID=A0A175R4P0_9HYPH|nr:threonine-phosphate decarboxylase CobD [Aureimonas ureilytica]KTQ86309.1 cobalamin biosynthesis protein CobC [Aureimonas ureilytica]
MKEALHHGGALDAAVARYGGARADWLDLSTGINPVPPPLPEIDPVLWARLPERALEERARSALRRFTGASEGVGIALAPGTQALIALLPHLLPPGPAAVLFPSYEEHGRALAQAGHAVTRFADLSDIPAGARLVTLVSPNNPDGRRFPPAAVLALADRLAAQGGLLVLDEAFADAEPGASLAADAGRPGLLILRSFGKFFGLAGLRFGAALGEPALTARIEARFGPWAVSGPALSIAAALMKDEAGAAALREGIGQRAEWTRQALTAAGLAPVGGTALFSLLSVPDATKLFEGLARRHILTRPFTYRHDWLRLGTVRDEREAERLTRALRAALADVDG